MKKQEKDMHLKNKTFDKQIKYSGFSTNTGFKKVGFVIPSLDPNQVAYSCISNCNKWLNNNFGANFCIFYDKNYIPCVDPLFARFHTTDVFGFEGSLIATSMESALNIKTATTSKRYYYIYDLEWIRPWFKLPKEQVASILENKDIIKFTRSEDYIKELKNAGCQSLVGVVEDFDIDKILEIINA